MYKLIYKSRFPFLELMQRWFELSADERKYIFKKKCDKTFFLKHSVRQLFHKWRVVFCTFVFDIRRMENRLKKGIKNV